jgi:hypothetical protein
MATLKINKTTHTTKYRKSNTKKDKQGRRRCRVCGKYMGHK